jgi:UDP-glucose 4-epimerase
MIRRALITGGAGLVGSHISDLLVRGSAGALSESVREGGPEVVVLDDFSRGCRENLAEAEASGHLRIITGDVRDPRAVSDAMEGVDIVFHQAAIRITQCAEQPRLAKEVLVDGSFNVLEAAVRAGVRKVVAASSASVYGLAEAFPTPEAHHPYANRTLYGAAKLFDEGLLRSFHEMYGLDYVALRYFNVYGPRMDVFGAYTEVLVRWMEAIAAGRPPLIFGDGTDTMDFIHVEDVARANILAALAPVTDAVFNVASGVETTLNGLAEALLSIMGSSIKPEHALPRRVNAVSRRLASTEQAREQLGFEARVGLEEGLRSLVEWWRHARLATKVARA